MKIIQMLTNLNYGDAIGNDVLALHRTFQAMGHESVIMAATIHERLADEATPIAPERIDDRCVVLMHKGAGDFISGMFASLRGKKVLVYHNITPPGFYAPYDLVFAWNLWRGRRQVSRMADGIDEAWGDSRYNCEELVRLGVPRSKVRVLPILMDFSKYDGIPDPQVAKALGEQKGAKLLFVGRIAPNKKQQDVIKVFYEYRKRFDERAQLYLIGGWMGNEKYYAKLRGFIADLGIDGVHMPGHVSDEEMLAYFRGADAFVCMSEHEGFCVPLLEAMYCGVPVLAHAASAVTETMGNHDLLFAQKDYAAISQALHRALTDEAFRNLILRQQARNLARYASERTKARLASLLRGLADGQEGEP